MADSETPPDGAHAAPDADQSVAGQVDDAAAVSAADTPAVRDDIVTVTLRRSPKYTVFLLLGAAVGVVVALILTVAFRGEGQPGEAGYTYSPVQVFGFLTLLCVPIAVALAGIVALVLDRAAGRRARELTVEHAHIRVEE